MKNSCAPALHIADIIVLVSQRLIEEKGDRDNKRPRSLVKSEDAEEEQECQEEDFPAPRCLRNIIVIT